MKPSIKSLAIFIALSMILNGCSIYYKKEASLEEAYLAKKHSKLITNENKKIYLKKIILKDSTYYGIYKLKGEEITFPLSNETHQSLRIKNRTASTLINVGGFVTPIGVFTLLLIGTGFIDADSF